MGHVSSCASVKIVFPAPVKWLLWAVKGPLLFMICKNPLQQLRVRTFRAAASSCRLLAVSCCVAACEERQHSVDFSFFQLTTRFVPLRFFVPLCSRRATRKACAAVEPRLFAWPRQPRARRLLYPLHSPTTDRPLVQWGSLSAMSAEVETPAAVPADAALTATNSSSPPTSPATSKVPFKKEKKKGEWWNTPPDPNTPSTKKWPLVFLLLFCWTYNVPVLFCISPREDRWVPAGQVSRGRREVQGQADWHRWRLRRQRRQNVPGLHDETKSKR